jgi:hypothetical protein
MQYLSRRTASAFLALAITTPLVTSLPAVANGKLTQPGTVMNYFNPFQKKQGYLNQSQDRLIKKKRFKTENVAVKAQPVTNRELGIFALVPHDKLTDLDFANQLLANKRVNGLSVLVPWSTIQTSEDNFNWEPVDQLVSACEKAGKTLILRVSACGIDTPDSDGKQVISDLPKWVIDSGIKTIKYTDPQGREHQMPLFWDKDYLAKWSNFIVEMADKYDKNPNIHSIGITGGGYQGSTSVIPGAEHKANNAKGEVIDLNAAMKKEYGMTQRELVTHWKYVSDLFPKHFHQARLNFNINPPVRGRAGEDSLDEIADYLVYRYGERVFVTRQGFETGRHKFDDYRLLLKYRNDTLTGIQFPDKLVVGDAEKIVKNALDDGVSFVEVPPSLLDNKDEKLQAAFDQLQSHIGYQIVSQKATLSEKLAAGEPAKASFAFMNIGAAPALRPERMFDKDTPSSYRVQIEFRDAEGKPVLQNLHTPPTPTTRWVAGQTFTWEEELKMVDANKRQLPPGEYTAYLSIVDPNSQRKILFLNATTATSGTAPTSTDTVELGKVLVTANAASENKMEASAGSPQGN